MIQNISQLSATLDGYQSSKPASVSRDGIGTTGTGHNAKVHGSLVTHDFHVVEKVPLSFSTFISWLMQAISRATGHIPNMETLFTRMNEIVLNLDDMASNLEASQLLKLAGTVENLRDRFLIKRGHITSRGDELPQDVNDSQACRVDRLAKRMVKKLENLAEDKRVPSHIPVIDSLDGRRVQVKPLSNMPASILSRLQRLPQEAKRARLEREAEEPAKREERLGSLKAKFSSHSAPSLRAGVSRIEPPVRRKTQKVKPLTVFFPENMQFASGAAVATDISWKG